MMSIKMVSGCSAHIEKIGKNIKNVARINM